MIIQPYEPSFEEQVKQLFKETFWHRSLSDERSKEHAKPLQSAIDDRNVILATDDASRVLLGFGFFSIMTNPQRAIYVGGKHWSSYPENFNTVKEHYGKLGREIGVSTEVHYFENAIVQTKRPLYKTDAYFEGVVVLPENRRCGIAHALIEKRLRIVWSAPTVYVDLSEQSPLRKTYEQFGFQPLVQIRPTSHDGSSSLFMAKIIR